MIGLATTCGVTSTCGVQHYNMYSLTYVKFITKFITASVTMMGFVQNLQVLECP